MSPASAKLFSALLLMCMSLQTAFSCSCLFRPYCEATMAASLVAHVKVIDVQEQSSEASDSNPFEISVNNGKNLFTLQLINVYKGESSVDVGESFNVTSEISSAMCGVLLNVDEEYVLNVDDNQTINSCQQHASWPPSEDQLEVLDRGATCCSETCDNCEMRDVECVTQPCERVAVCLDEQTPVCPQICAQVYIPVCGTDNQTYSNSCFLNIASCNDPDIQFAHQGRCSDESHPQLCPLLIEPVCGSDGITYQNMCLLNNAALNTPGLQVAYEGQCQIETTSAPPCNERYKPMCGTNNVTYTNKCWFEQAACKNPNLKLAYKGKCRTRCIDNGDPVCAMRDGGSFQLKTFKSECHMKRASRGRVSWVLLHRGQTCEGNNTPPV